MTEIVFRPESFRKGGDIFSTEGGDISSSVAATLATMSVDALGCNRGGHAADFALSLVVPPLLEVFTETITGIAEGLKVTGDMLEATAVAYENTEAANTDAGNDAATV